MTATEILARLGELGVIVAVQDGQTTLKPPVGGWTSITRRAVAELKPHMDAVRSELLRMAGCDLWDKDAALGRMFAADTEVERCGGCGTEPALTAAANNAVECYRRRDRDGLEKWCERVEQLARENRSDN